MLVRFKDTQIGRQMNYWRDSLCVCFQRFAFSTMFVIVKPTGVIAPGFVNVGLWERCGVGAAERLWLICA